MGGVSAKMTHHTNLMNQVRQPRQSEHTGGRVGGSKETSHCSCWMRVTPGRQESGADDQTRGHGISSVIPEVRTLDVGMDLAHV